MGFASAIHLATGSLLIAICVVFQKQGSIAEPISVIAGLHYLIGIGYFVRDWRRKGNRES